jgi:DNA mismatch repair protein MutS2
VTGRLATAKHEDTGVLRAVNLNTFRTLEFEPIRARLLALAGSVPGRARVRSLAPGTDPAAVRASLRRTTEALALLAQLGRQPYHDLPDLSEILVALGVEGMHLEPGALLDVASFVEGIVESARSVSRAEGAPQLSRRASEVKDLTELAVAIRRAILPGGEVADDASPKLRETRRQLARLRLQLQSVLESLLRGKDADRVLQDKLVTTRNERYVLLVKAEHRSALPGIVHGASGSGQSVFVEPMPAVELNNDIVALGEEERAEVVRILRALTARVAERALELGEAQVVLGELDELQAKALLARDLDAVEPEIVEELLLDLPSARHPLLHEPVPVSLRVDPAAPVLVISGPNTGGKTVALKTAGLLSLMAQCGLHVPAAPGCRLPAFRRIYADIGDEQSIAANLSTFSAHLAAIVEMTRDLAFPTLVLLDEVGAGTDPTEGGALGVAVVEHFRARGALTIATTHHGLMKSYAQSTPGVACASFGYDPATYAPTYRLTLGQPGRSLALEMAERLGLPSALVQDARSRVDAKQAQAEALLKELEERRGELQVEEGRLAAERQDLEAGLAALRAAEREIAARKRAEVEAFALQLRRRLEEAARKAKEAVDAAVERLAIGRGAGTAAATRARAEAAGALRLVQKEALADPELGIEHEAPAPAEVAVGARVKVTSLGVVGEVTAVQGDDLELAVGGKRLRVPRGEVVPLAAGRPRSSTTGVSLSRPPRPSSSVPAEVNLVGLTVDEALPRVDKLLDDAALSERREIRVIHGFGAGRLRKAVAGLLEGHPHVASFHPGGAREGGGGVTIVELKD